MNKFIFSILSFISVFLICSSAWSSDFPIISATPKGPNQINLTWSGISDCGYGYKIEIQSDYDSRYSNWTELATVPYWVTESHYTDPQDGTSGWGAPCQYPIYSLKYNTTYNFRVRPYAGTSYSSYSNIASARTTNPSAIRYVSTFGSDDNGGTNWNDAWRHIHAAQAVSAGTLVLIAGGNYAADYLHIRNSGSNGNKIVFMANPGETVAITSGGLDQGVIYLGGVNYVVVDGINLNGADPVGKNDATVRLTDGADRNAIVNLEAENLKWPFIVETNGRYNIFHGIYMHDCGASNNQQEPDGICMNGNNASYNVVQNSTFSRIGHDAVLMTNGAVHNKVLNNKMDMYWGGGANCGHSGTQYNLIEGNFVTNVAVGLENAGDYYKPSIQLSSPNNTARRNIIIKGRSASSDCSHGFEVSGIEGTNANGNLIYNNIVYNNGGYGIFLFGSTGQQNVVIANNIFYFCSTGCGVEHHVGMVDTYSGSVAHHNVILDMKNGLSAPDSLTCMCGWGNEKTTTDANSDWSSNFYYNLITAPDFVDDANSDFHLNANSLLIDAGQTVIDSTWGTIGHNGSAPDIGAFEYMGGSGGGSSPGTPQIFTVIPNQ